MDKPPWLEDEPEIKALLLSFAKRVDDNSATTKPLRSSLKVGHFAQNEQGDLSWELLNKLTPDLITIKLSPKRSDSVPDWSGALVYFDPSNKHKLFEWLDYNPDDSLQRWQQALEASDLAVFDSVNLASLKETPIAFPGKTDAAVIQKLVLIASNNAGCNNRYHTLREISAHYFWGDSKFFDNKSDWLANSFTDLCISARKVQVNYFLPKQYDQVLFVENLDTYHQLIQKRCDLTQTLAIVYAAGFRLTASRIRTQDGVSLHEAAQSQGCSQAKSQLQSETFIDWWFGAEVGNLPCFFWGDFDFSGMGILKLLRHQFNDMQLWQPGYQAMLQQVEAGNAHPMSLRDKSGQTDPFETGCDYADTVILPLLRQHQSCFDQEGIDLDRLR